MQTNAKLKRHLAQEMLLNAELQDRVVIVSHGSAVSLDTVASVPTASVESKSELTAADAQCDETDLQQQVKKLEGEVNQQRKMNLSLQKELEDCQSKNVEPSPANDNALATQLRLTKEKLRQALRECRDLQKQNDLLQSEPGDSAAMREIARLRAEVRELRAKHETQASDSGAVLDHLKSLREELRKAKHTIRVLEGELEAARSEQRTLQRTASKLQRRNSELLNQYSDSSEGRAEQSTLKRATSEKSVRSMLGERQRIPTRSTSISAEESTPVKTRRRPGSSRAGRRTTTDF